MARLISLFLGVLTALVGCSSRNDGAVALQNRAKEFLARPLPKGMPYVPDSISERFIAEFAKEGKIQIDEESFELLQICVMEAENTASQRTGDEQQHYQDTATILRSILDHSKRTR